CRPGILDRERLLGLGDAGLQGQADRPAALGRPELSQVDSADLLRRRMTVSRLNRRRALTGFVATVVSAGCSNGPTATPTLPVPLWPKVFPTATASPVAGKLLTVHDGNIHVFDLATRKETQLTHFPQRVFPTAPAISPDG